jgi:hypothetical protein
VGSRFAGPLVALSFASLVGLASFGGCANGKLVTCTNGDCDAGSCTAGQVQCGAACVDTSTDPSNCGGCGTKCSAGQVCNAGSCGPSSCSNGETSCPADGGAKCTNTKTDSANCGTCGKTCPLGASCQNGTCQNPCPLTDAGQQSLCQPDGGAPYCVDTQSDDSNCGSCGHACAGGEICVSGACENPCTSNDAGATTLCVPDGGAPYCADTQNDSANCGTCAHACNTNESCAAGICTTETAVEIFPPSGTLYDPGNTSVWSARYYTITFAQSQKIVGIQWRANLATTDSMYGEIWDPGSQASLAKGSTVTGAGTAQFYTSTISYTVAANTAYLIGIFMSNANTTVFPRKDSPTYPFTVSGPHGNIDVSACW